MYYTACVTANTTSAMTSFAASHMTLRLTEDDAQLVARLIERTSMSKSQLVKQALRLLAQTQLASTPAQVSLFALGAERFGKYGDSARQASNIKAVVRARLDAKRRA